MNTDEKKDLENQTANYNDYNKQNRCEPLGYSISKLEQIIQPLTKESSQKQFQSSKDNGSGLNEKSTKNQIIDETFETNQLRETGKKDNNNIDNIKIGTEEKKINKKGCHEDEKNENNYMEDDFIIDKQIKNKIIESNEENSQKEKSDCSNQINYDSSKSLVSYGVQNCYGNSMIDTYSSNQMNDNEIIAMNSFLKSEIIQDPVNKNLMPGEFKKGESNSKNNHQELNVKKLVDEDKILECDDKKLEDNDIKLECDDKKLEDNDEKLEDNDEKLEDNDEKLEDDDEKLEDNDEKLEDNDEKLEDNDEKLEDDDEKQKDYNKKLEENELNNSKSENDVESNSKLKVNEGLNSPQSNQIINDKKVTILSLNIVSDSISKNFEKLPTKYQEKTSSHNENSEPTIIVTPKNVKSNQSNNSYNSSKTYSPKNCQTHPFNSMNNQRPGSKTSLSPRISTPISSESSFANDPEYHAFVKMLFKTSPRKVAEKHRIDSPNHQKVYSIHSSQEIEKVANACILNPNKVVEDPALIGEIISYLTNKRSEYIENQQYDESQKLSEVTKRLRNNFRENDRKQYHQQKVKQLTQKAKASHKALDEAKLIWIDKKRDLLQKQKEERENLEKQQKLERKALLDKWNSPNIQRKFNKRSATLLSQKKQEKNAALLEDYIIAKNFKKLVSINEAELQEERYEQMKESYEIVRSNQIQKQEMEMQILLDQQKIARDLLDCNEKDDLTKKQKRVDTVDKMLKEEGNMNNFVAIQFKAKKERVLPMTVTVRGGDDVPPTVKTRIKPAGFYQNPQDNLPPPVPLPKIKPSHSRRGSNSCQIPSNKKLGSNKFVFNKQ